MNYVESLEEQKHAFQTFVSGLLQEKKIATKTEPTKDEYMKSILLTPGRIISIRVYKQTTSRRFRQIIANEYLELLHNLLEQSLGTIISYTNAGTGKSIKLFVKVSPDNFPATSLCPKSEYESKYNVPLHKCITQNMVDYIEH